MTPGFLVIDKAPGLTSHDIVAMVRAVLGIKKVGHTGTLDPFATGRAADRFGIDGELRAAPTSHQEQTIPILRYAVMVRVQNLPRGQHIVAVRFELLDDLLQKALLLTDRQTFDVLEDEIVSSQFVDDAREVFDQRIARIVERPLTDEREPLTGRTAENDIHFTPTEVRPLADFRTR